MTARHRPLFEAVADVAATDDAWLHRVARGLCTLVPHAAEARGHVYALDAPLAAIDGGLAAFLDSQKPVGTLAIGGASCVVVHGAAAPLGGGARRISSSTGRDRTEANGASAIATSAAV